MNQFDTSIVILCYNGLVESTRPCLESIIANTPLDSYELIVVDNASVDGTAEYLETFAAQHANVRIQLNDTNKGYAAGNNDGIRLAHGQYVILLNNDTLLPDGWLHRLLNLFNEQPDVGMVGPVTNSAGNEQHIELKGLNEKNFEEIAAVYVERHKGVWFTTEKLGFFCVAIRRTLFEKIGYLDETFGLGMFEDDDYCIRAKKAGFSLAVVEDCFVYHKGSVSFRKLADRDYVELFNKNRGYFFEKHGTLWTYTDIAFALWVKIRGDLEAVEKNDEKAAVERIKRRVEGMTNALFQLREVEQRSAEIGGKAHIEIQLAEKQRLLKKMSDWATALKQDNEQLTETASAARKELMAMSDWAASMQREMEEMSHSRCYRLFRFLQRRGI